MTATTAPALADFALRTHDAAWIRRHNGRDDGDGRITVRVPASEIEAVTVCGRPMLRHRFADCPKDFPSPVVLCPAQWVR